ncbi:hypothetical protein RRG08_065451 [Elysia crispata]|uniref:Uncharacterized protein n=1 Tax=Elysia crispata TaxID=231223 RepID=A0AAE0XW09_9GAST|nr:hypothetical protein RRG08_065451 [Elysia crispata]
MSIVSETLYPICEMSSNPNRQIYSILRGFTILLLWFVKDSYSSKGACFQHNLNYLPYRGTCRLEIFELVNSSIGLKKCKTAGGSLYQISDCDQNRAVSSAKLQWFGIHLYRDVFAVYQPINQGGLSCAAVSNKVPQNGLWNDVACSPAAVQFVCEQFPDSQSQCRIPGQCSSRCLPGYQGVKCDIECPAGSYGLDCLSSCSSNCAGPNRTCDFVNGTCLLGCEKGYMWPKCDQGCSAGRYGNNCSQTCSPNCAGPNNACDELNGICVLGCDVGYKGDLCDAGLYHILGVHLHTVAFMCVIFLLVWSGLALLVLHLQKVGSPEIFSSNVIHLKNSGELNTDGTFLELTTDEMPKPTITIEQESLESTHEDQEFQGTNREASVKSADSGKGSGKSVQRLSND